MTDPIDPGESSNDAFDSEVEALFAQSAQESVESKPGSATSPDEGGVAAPGDERSGLGMDPSLDADVVTLVEMAQRLEVERDDYLADAQRIQAEFANYRRRTDQERLEQSGRATERLVQELLPVLDACEAAVTHGAEHVAPLQSMLLSTLERQGLKCVNEVDVLFDPNLHDAVASDPPGEDDTEGPVVVEVMRTGYTWNGRVTRAAMVKVRG